MKLSNLLDDLGSHGFHADYKIMELPLDIPLFSIYYVCELGGILFQHDSMGVIYTEVLEPSASLLVSDIQKIENYLNNVEMCLCSKEKDTIDCHTLAN